MHNRLSLYYIDHKDGINRYVLVANVSVSGVLLHALSVSPFTVTTVTVYSSRPVKTDVVVSFAGVSVLTTEVPSLTVTWNFVNVPVVGAVHPMVNPSAVTEITTRSVAGFGPPIRE